MKEAQDRLAPYLNNVHLAKSSVDLVMNTTGDYVCDLSEIRKQLIEQVVRPVRWEKGIRSMLDHGVDLFVEIGCGKTLAGMNKRIGVAVPTISIEKIEDLQDFLKECTTCSC